MNAANIGCCHVDEPGVHTWLILIPSVMRFVSIAFFLVLCLWFSVLGSALARSWSGRLAIVPSPRWQGTRDWSVWNRSCDKGWQT